MATGGGQEIPLKAALSEEHGTYTDEETSPHHFVSSMGDGPLNAIAKSDNSSIDPELSEKARDLTDRVLHFLSHASNETLGACMVGLGAITYLILGRIALFLIGIVAGIIIHATWEDREKGATGAEARAVEGRRRKEKGLDIVQRILDLRLPALDEESGDSPHTTTHGQGKMLDYTGFAPETKSALEDFTEAIVGDYVSWWYRPILPDERSFPSACRQTLTQFFLAISNRLSRKRPGDIFLDFVTNSSSIVLVFLSELSAALSASRGVDSQQAIKEYLEENPSCSLGNVIDREQQKRKLNAVAEDVIRTFVDAKAYACEPVHAFLREILAGLVLDMTVASCSRADFLNEWIIWALEESETTELVEAIDAGVSDAANNNAVKNAAKSANDSGTDVDSADSQHRDSQAQTKAEHRRTVSKAEAAMEEAMREAQRMNEMIAEEEAKRNRNVEETRHGVEMTDQDGFLPRTNGVTEDSTESSTLQSEETHNNVEPPPESDPQTVSGFKSFDQILSTPMPTTLHSDTSPLPSPPLAQPQMTLEKARVSIFDDSVPGEKGNIRSKPIAEYLLQVEPASAAFPGWMIARKYTDFESLHEVLRRISVISGVTAFAERHPALPGWKGNTKSGLRTELEKYLQDALSYRRLAESEGIKRFLDKDQHLPRASSNKSNFGFPNPAAFETMGKGVLDVLSSAPKGAATSGKAIVGGVTGVFGGVASLGQKKQTPKGQGGRSSGLSSTPTSQMPPKNDAAASALQRATPSQDSMTSTKAASQEDLRPANGSAVFPTLSTSTPRQSEDLESQHRYSPSANDDQSEMRPGTPRSINDKPPAQSPASERTNFHLPPPPSEISDDYHNSPRPSFDNSATLRSSISTAPTTNSLFHNSNPSLIQSEIPPRTFNSKPHRATPTPLNIQETTVAVELFFATINELYTLSSAWTLRLTLLNTAKSFLLRPGNANLEAIRQLLQSTIIDANTSDSGIATHINKTRENALPTEEELKKWPPPLTPGESERRREKARKLLVAKGMPQALTSVMGQAASGEALGKVFECLQVPDVARGLVFAITLQAVRALTQ